MKRIDLNDIQEYVGKSFIQYYRHQENLIRKITFDALLRQNPYFLLTNNTASASHLIERFLDAFLSSSEEKLFGDFLEGLAVFIAEKTCSGHKSAATGVDLEFINDGIHELV